MPTNVIHSIGTGGDYTTIAAWEAAQQGDFVSADEVHIGELANQVFSESISILGATTDATRKWILRAAAGAENGGDPAAGALIQGSGTGTTFFARDDIDIVDIRVAGDATQNAVTLQAFQFDANTIVNVSRCIISNASSNDSPAMSCGNQATSTLNIDHCLIGPSGGWGISCTGAIATVNVRNTDAVDCNAMSSNFRGGFDASKANITYTNCVGYNNGNADFYNTGSTLINCASSDATAHGTNPVTGITSADFVNAVGGDYHLSAASNLRGAGANLIGDIDVDIDGDAWPAAGAWDIGFDYYVSSGATITGTPQLQSLTANGAVEIFDTITGSPQLQALTATGSISVGSPVTITGTPQLQSLTATGQVDISDRITGTPQLQSLQSSGAIEITDTITGTPQLQALTAAGSIQVGDTATITGAPQLQSLAATGQVDISDRITGSPQLQALLSSGTITISDTITGTPQLQSLAAGGSIDVFGTVTITGTPQLQSLTAAGTITAVVDAVQIIASTQHIETTLASAQHITRTITQTGYLS